MANTIENVALERGVATNLYTATGLPSDTQITIENLTAAPLKIFIGDTPPLDWDNDNEGGFFNRINGFKSFTPPESSLPVWALCESNQGVLNVREASVGSVSIKGPTTSFNEISVAETVPVTQISAQYAQDADLNIVESNGGTHNIENSLYECISGTNPFGLAAINALKKATYKPGQGLIGRTSCIFDAPAPGTLQATGFITSEDSLTFGYLGTDFGILYASGGVVEAQELTLTAAASGNETATVTLNGVAYNADITAGTVEHNAWEIAEELTPLIAPYLVTSNGDTLFFMNREPTPQPGAFTFASTGTAAGTFVQINAGQDVTIDITKQEDWNQDAASWLQPQFGNVYEIKFSYLGFSAVDFYIKNPATGKSVLVHTLDYSGQVTPIVRNPTFRVGWVARNLGNPTSVTVKGASAMAANEGVVTSDAIPLATDVIAVPVDDNPTNLITLRNRFHFGGIINRAVIRPTLISAATDANRGALFRVLVNATFNDDMNFSYIDRDNSITEYATDSVGVSGGRVIASFSATRETPFVLYSADFQFQIEPDDYITITAQRKVGGTNEEMDLSVTWVEEL